MKQELTEALFRDFPNLYAGRSLGPRQNLLCFGFECGDGWEPLIRRLSEKLEPLGIGAVQVKEKFGGLRFYTNGGSDEVDAFIRAAEEESFKTCEHCGEPGTTRGGGWIRTLCDKCEDKYNGTAR